MCSSVSELKTSSLQEGCVPNESILKGHSRGKSCTEIFDSVSPSSVAATGDTVRLDLLALGLEKLLSLVGVSSQLRGNIVLLL